MRSACLARGDVIEKTNNSFIPKINVKQKAQVMVEKMAGNRQVRTRMGNCAPVRNGVLGSAFVANLFADRYLGPRQWLKPSPIPLARSFWLRTLLLLCESSPGHSPWKGAPLASPSRTARRGCRHRNLC